MLLEYGEFIRRELPPLVRRNLESMLEFEIQEALRDRIVDIVRNLEQELSSRFRHARNSSEHFHGGGREVLGLEQPSIPPPTGDHQTALTEQLELSNLLDSYDGEVWLEDSDYTDLYLMLSHSATEPRADFGSNPQGQDNA